MAASELALLHNDQAVLENHHAATTFALLSLPHTSVFSPLHSRLTQQEVRSLRKMMIASILSTDMARHFEMCHQLDAAEPECASINWHSESDRQFVINLITHSSDLSGQITPLHIAREWEERVTREFMLQSALEQRYGFPLTSYFKDLHIERVRLKNHINFLDFVMTPLWTGLVELFPSLRPCAENLVRNRKFFMDRMAEVREEEHRVGATGEVERSALLKDAHVLAEMGVGGGGGSAEEDELGHVVTIHEDRSRCASIDEETADDIRSMRSARGSQSSNAASTVHHTFGSSSSSPTSSSESSRKVSVSSSVAASLASSPMMSSRTSLAASAAISEHSSPLMPHSFLQPLAISINTVPEDEDHSSGSSATPSPSHASFASTTPSSSVFPHPSSTSSSLSSSQPAFASTAPSDGGASRKHESIKDRRESRWGDQLVTHHASPASSPGLLSLSPASSTASLSPVSPPLSGPLLSPFSVGPGMNGGGLGGGGEVRKKMSIGERRVSVIQTLQAASVPPAHGVNGG